MSAICSPALEAAEKEPAMKQVWKLNSIISLIFSALSVVLLIKEGLDVGVGAPLLRLLHYYKSLIDFLLTWADNPLRDFIGLLKSFVLMNFHFNIWWKYLFIPMWLYFFSSAMTALTMTSLTMTHRILYCIFDVATGGSIALISSVAASALPLDTASARPVLIISAGFVAFGFGDICWHTAFLTPVGANRLNKFLWFFAAYPLANFIIAVVVVTISSILAQSGYLVPAVAQLLCIVVLMALRNLAAAAYGATFERMQGETWRTKFAGYATGVHGRRVLIVIFAAILFLLLSRGLEIVNL